VLPGGLSLDKCFNLDGSNPTYSNSNQYCQLLTRDPVTGGITSLLQETDNLGALKTRGIDVEFNWDFGLDSLGIPAPGGVIELKTVASRLLDYEVQALPGGPFSDYTNTVSPPNGGSYGSLPKWKDVTTVGYLQGSWSVGVRWRYIGAMRSLATVSDPQSTTPGTTAYSLLDLFGAWDLSDHLKVNGGVNNLMNRQPMVVDGIPGNTEPSTYDILGRSFFISVSARF
jgi:iron complex outermembrane recepter protein